MPKHGYKPGSTKRVRMRGSNLPVLIYVAGQYVENDWNSGTVIFLKVRTRAPYLYAKKPN